MGFSLAYFSICNEAEEVEVMNRADACECVVILGVVFALTLMGAWVLIFW